MNLIKEMDMSIELSNQIKSQIESDCIVGKTDLGGATVLEYENVRKKHLDSIKHIHAELLTLRSFIERDL